MKKYWMVHRPGTVARVDHPTKAQAVHEAMRLAHTTGHRFVVLEAIGVVGDGAELPRIDTNTLPFGPDDDF